MQTLLQDINDWLAFVLQNAKRNIISAYSRSIHMYLAISAQIVPYLR